MEGGSLETPKGRSFGLDVFVRVTRGKPLGMTGPDCRAQHTKAAVYPHSISSYLVAKAFPGHCRVSININARR